MKIGVCLKQVPATDTRLKVSDKGKEFLLADAKWEISPYDEFALEEGLRLRDAGKATEVIVFTLGGADAEQRIRDALARGADRAVRLDDPSFGDLDTLGVARVLAAAAKTEGVDLVLTGKQAGDYDNAQVPAMIAEILDWSQALVVDRLEIDGGQFKAWRVSGGGVRDIIEGELPAVISCTKGLNEPRYASLKGIMAAKKKTLAVSNAAAIGLGSVGAPVSRVTSRSLPADRPAGRILSGDNATVVRELVRLLREEAKVI